MNNKYNIVSSSFLSFYTMIGTVPAFAHWSKPQPKIWFEVVPSALKLGKFYMAIC